MKPTAQTTCAMDTVPLYRCRLVQDGEAWLPVEPMRSEAQCASIARALLADRDRETLLCLFIAPDGYVIGAHIIAEGVLTEVPCHPREALKAAILANAHSIVLAHNHPGGDTTPSLGDLGCTKAMAAAGDAVGIELDDHLIVGGISARHKIPPVYSMRGQRLIN